MTTCVNAILLLQVKKNNKSETRADCQSHRKRREKKEERKIKTYKSLNTTCRQLNEVLPPGRVSFNRPQDVSFLSLFK